MEKYKEKIVGGWKDHFYFSMINDNDITEVIEHIRDNFYLSTPLTSGLEYSEQYFSEFDKVYYLVIPQGLSFYVRDLRNGKIIGARITFVQNKELEKTLKDLNPISPQMRKMNLIMGSVHDNANIYAHYNINNFINFFTACVDPNYRGIGLASEMYKRALGALRIYSPISHSEKYTIVKSNLTSPWTRKICENNGFEELARVYFNNFRDENGIPILNGRSDDEFVSFMALKLEIS